MSGIKFSLGKKKKLTKKPNLFNQETPKEDNDKDKVEIETYDNKPAPPKKLIIKPDVISHKITSEPLNFGLTTFNRSESTVTSSKLGQVEAESDSDEEYRKVPIEQFGIGFLRGLGYEAEEEEEQVEDKSVEHRQRGVTLGIGADPIAQDLAKDIMKGTPELPLIKKRKIDK
ncbi:uncharacterized protein SPAPADRAFT_64935 [Spathaspora passalidarum NRRL Y-27907]|uniref:Spp2/MOS2 G-patch domain-containing protein n=1 Tax=Spathaspora passalidarum (strain NRRL Y-27907 / 11-Y1) TaxID=619300 RepID=G3AII3_SPAPN|nr:uncharacterized protein SPAPADRAFT_64935 [Spathaspora passalidarum NRRL Y-27907]EGW33698.1 hypothetical protein SPAPADRAFT_64935 [Spathaspora passalidarum NRRL Y-27907]